MDDLKLIVTNRFNSLNYSELNNYKESIIDYILVQEDPLAYLSFLEDIFIKNYTFDAIKTFVLFQMLYNSNKTIDSNKLYKCLIKINLDSNNQSIREFIVLIKLGYQLFKKIINKEVSFDTLNNKQQRCLSIFVSQLTHIYNLSVDAVQNHLSLTGSIEHDILLLSSLSEKISLEDVIIQQMFPFSTMSELQNYLDNLRTTVNNNGQLNASRSFETMSNVLFLSKRCDLKTFGAILTSGLLASQFTNQNLNSPSSFELTLSKEISSLQISEEDIVFVIRDSLLNISSNTVGLCNVSVGIPSSSIEYILVSEYDARMGLLMAQNGLYIPIVSRLTKKTLFTYEDYQNLRFKMVGISHLSTSEYVFANEELLSIVPTMSSDDNTKSEENIITNYLINILSSLIKDIKTSPSSDLTSGTALLISTGSTNRGTNLPGGGDYDFMLCLDDVIIQDSSRVQAIELLLLKSLGQDSFLANGRGKIRLNNIVVPGIEKPVKIDITFSSKKKEQNYSTEIIIKERLELIREQHPDCYELVINNILYVKQLLGSAGVYKSKRTNKLYGGLGGVGVENWILQNGGSFVVAALEFLHNARGITFNQFKYNFPIWDFGQNYIRLEKRQFPYDNFVIHNLTEQGYYYLQDVLKRALLDLGVDLQLIDAPYSSFFDKNKIHSINK